MADDSNLNASLSRIVNAVSSFSSSIQGDNATAGRFGAIGSGARKDALNSPDAVINRLVALMRSSIDAGPYSDIGNQLSDMLALKPLIDKYQSAIRGILADGTSLAMSRNAAINDFLSNANMDDAPLWFEMVEMVHPILQKPKASFLSRALKEWGSALQYGEPYRFDYMAFEQTYQSEPDHVFEALLAGSVEKHAENVRAIERFVIWCLTRDRSQIEVRVNPGRNPSLANFASWFQNFMNKFALSNNISDPSLYIVNACIDQIEAQHTPEAENVLQKIARDHWSNWLPALSVRYPFVFPETAAQVAALRSNPTTWLISLLRLDSSAEDLERMIRLARPTNAEIEDALNVFGLEYTPNN